MKAAAYLLFPLATLIAGEISNPNTDHLAKRDSGEFKYKSSEGVEYELYDPEPERCVNVRGATLSAPAHSPHNDVDATATVFLDFDCQGETFYVMEPGKKLGERLKFRSVLFA